MGIDFTKRTLCTEQDRILRPNYSKIQTHFDQLSESSKIKLSEIEAEIKQLESEKNMQFLFHTTTVPANSNASLEVLADKLTACKPYKVSIKVSDYYTPEQSVIINGISFSDKSEKFVEILNVTVMGCPQLVNFDGVTVPTNRGISKFYSAEREVDWQVFGASAGQGLQITVRNPFERSLSVSIIIVGESTSTEYIGRF